MACPGFDWESIRILSTDSGPVPPGVIPNRVEMAIHPAVSHTLEKNCAGTSGYGIMQRYRREANHRSTAGGVMTAGNADADPRLQDPGIDGGGCKC